MSAELELPQASIKIMAYSSAFIQFLVMLVLIVSMWKYYRYYLRQRRERAVIASDTTFDQCLPPELIDEIMRHLDLPSLLSAAQVSRYWHYFACRDSIREPLFEKHTLNRLKIDDIISAGLPLNWLDYSSPFYLKQWHAEDYILSKRLNKSVVDVKLESIRVLLQWFGRFLQRDDTRSTHSNHNYLIKTRLQWVKEDKEFIHFCSPTDRKLKVAIHRSQIPTKNIAEEYEVIVDLNGFYLSKPFLRQIHRFRPTKLLDWKIGALTILSLIYAPILLMDITFLLRNQNSQNFSHGLTNLLGISVSLLTVILTITFSLNAIRFRKKILRTKLTIGILFIGLLYVGCVWHICEHWRNNGLCWLIGVTCHLYSSLFESFWYRRHYFGLKLFSTVTTILSILFLYALDWSLLAEYFETLQIWRTVVINIVHSLTVMMLINAERFLVESLIDLKPYWAYFRNTKRKEFKRGILLQIAVVTLFSLYAPAGFDNLSTV